MYFEDSEEAKEEWQKDLNSWKKRRKSSSLAKRRLHDGDDDDDDDVTSAPPSDAVVEHTNKSLKNRKWNKYLSMDGEEEEYEDDGRNGVVDSGNHYHDQHKHQLQSASSLPPKSPTWRTKDRESDITSSRKTGAIDDDDDENDDDDEVTDDRATEDKITQEKVIKIKQRSNNPKGFGFDIEGGREEKTSVRIQKVTRGSSADICGLRSGDIVLSLNGVDIGRHYKESVYEVIEDAIEKGTIELKIQRVKDKADLALSDEEEEEDMTMEVRRTRWSGSQSSHRSTPPLPPQPDHTNDFVESPPPLPVAPPPPVNWSTFPDDDDSGDDTPTFADNPWTTKHSTFNSVQSHNGVRSEADILRQQTRRKRPTSPDSKQSLSPQHSCSDHLKEEIALQKFKFLGLKPENSEELKLLKEKKILQEQKFETTFPATDDSNDVFEYSDKLSVAVRPTTLSKERKSADGNPSVSQSNGERIRLVNNTNGPRAGFNETSSPVSTNAKLKNQHSTEIKEIEAKGRKTVSEIRTTFSHQQPATYNSKLEANVRTSSSGPRKVAPTSTCNDSQKLRNGGIEKVETSRSAAEHWKKKDKEVKEKEENEKREMKERHDKFNKENNFPPFSSGKPSQAKTFDSSPDSSSYAYFTGSSDDIRDQYSAQPTSVAQSSESSLTASINLKATEKFGFKKNQYKPIQLKLDKSETTLSVDRSSFMRNHKTPQENILKSPAGDTREGDGMKSVGSDPQENNKTYLSDSSKSQGDSSFTRAIPVSSVEYRKEFQNTSRDEHCLDHSVIISGKALGESNSLRNSLREEEMELQKLREQQEIEKIKLERVKEEKKVEELKMMRMKEEDEVQRMKEQRMKEQKMMEQRMKEEHESRHLERENIKAFESSKEQNKRQQADLHLQHPPQKDTSNVDEVLNKDSEVIRTLYSAPKPFQPSDKRGLATERIEGNSYEKYSRTVTSEAHIPQDKAQVKTVVLNKPNFFGGTQKRPIIDRTDDKVLSNASASNITTSHQNFGSTQSTRVLSFDDYANPTHKSPSCFGPTFKRINDNADINTSDTQYHHSRSHSTSEAGTGQGSNISYLLYGDNSPKGTFSNHVGLVANNSSYGKTNLNAESSSNQDHYKMAKKLSKHWIVEEAERKRAADKDGLSRPSYFGGNNASVGAKSSSFQPNFRQRSKSGNFQNEPKKANPEITKPPAQASFQKQMQPNARRSSSSYSFDSTHPGTFSYASFAQPPQHHPTMGSASTDRQASPATTWNNSPTATDRLFPGSSSNQVTSPKNTFINPAANTNHERSQHHATNDRYISSSAIDSLFAHNDPYNYASDWSHKEHSRINPQPASRLFNKKISASYVNLAQGSWDEPAPGRGWPAQGAKMGQTNNQGGHHHNYNRTASQFRHGITDY